MWKEGKLRDMYPTFEECAQYHKDLKEESYKKNLELYKYYFNTSYWDNVPEWYKKEAVIHHYPDIEDAIGG